MPQSSGTVLRTDRAEADCGRLDLVSIYQDPKRIVVASGRLHLIVQRRLIRTNL